MRRRSTPSPGVRYPAPDTHKFAVWQRALPAPGKHKIAQIFTPLNLNGLSRHLPAENYQVLEQNEYRCPENAQREFWDLT
jgi:hypothetical protein